MKLIKYTKKEKTEDKTSPFLHEAIFELNNSQQVTTSTSDGIEVTVSDPEISNEQFNFIAKVMRTDWNIRKELLADSAIKFESMGMKVNDLKDLN